jgi:hypothetical protein
MAITDTNWQAIHAAFDPMRRLWGDEIDLYYEPRPHGPLEELKVRLEPGLAAERILLIGHTGSGKSSELARLVRDVGNNFFVVWIDSDKNLDIFDATHIELMFLIGVSVYHIAEQTLPDRPNRNNLDKLVESLETLVQEQTSNQDWTLDTGELVSNLVAFGLGAAVAATGGAAVSVMAAGLAKSGLDLARSYLTFKIGGSREEVRHLEVRPEIANIIRAVNDIIEDVEAKAQCPLLLIVDGLDKFELKEAREFFVRSQVLNQLSCRTVYVTPLALYYSADFRQARERFLTQVFPNVAIYPPDNRNTPLAEGYRVFQAVVNRRLKPLGLAYQELFEDKALDLLIQMSGGVMREFIRLVQSALVSARVKKLDRINYEIATEAMFRARRDFKAGLDEQHFQEIARFLRSGVPSGTLECEELLENLYILSYINNNLWYDIHPNVLPLFYEWEKQTKTA